MMTSNRTRILNCPPQPQIVYRTLKTLPLLVELDNDNDDITLTSVTTHFGSSMGMAEDIVSTGLEFMYVLLEAYYMPNQINLVHDVPNHYIPCFSFLSSSRTYSPFKADCLSQRELKAHFYEATQNYFNFKFIERSLLVYGE